MEQICERVAGLDVHRDAVAVCVRLRGHAAACMWRRHGSRPPLAGWRCWPGGWRSGRCLVAMEATGVYWKPVYYALEDRFELWLCNAHHVKNVRAARPICPMPSGWPTSRRTGWSGLALCRRRRSASFGC